MTFGELDALPLTALVTRPVTEQFPDLRPGAARFDAPAGTLVHHAVRDVMTRYPARAGADVAHPRSRTVLDWAAGRFRTLIGAPGGIVSFGADMTSLTEKFVRSVAPALRPGDEVMCTALDHAANVDPWRESARRQGAVVRVADLSPSGELTVDAVTEQLSPRTRWVAVTAGSNVLGSAPDIPAICAAARSTGARIFVDGVQAPAHRFVDVAAWGCDAFVTSADKWYGPRCGVLWNRDGRPRSVVARTTDRPGVARGPGIEAVLAAGVAAEVLLRWDRSAVFRHGERLANLLARGLRMIDGVRVLGRPDGRSPIPIVSFQVVGRSAAEVAAVLAAEGITVGHGTFGAEPALRAVSPDAPESLRAGVARYTTRDDVRALLGGVAAIASPRA
ncbi:aminotransferase class V-fold PLP-dependent enzyme [Micromonospora sp. NPDC047730]|uniref:aminotransferase class V-fold PLP-dependent enzyme n=1 Tax=Micromonospora sp. NPDC047730 TaxID=3364253 RepID=UPI0037197684